MSLVRKSLFAAGATTALVLSTVTTASAVTPPIGSPTISFQNEVNDNGNCTYNNTSGSPTAPTPVVNGPTSTATDLVTGTVTNSSDSTDVSTVSASTTAHVKMTASSSYPSAITMSFTGTSTDIVGGGHATSACTAEVGAIVLGGGTVTLTRPGLVTLTAHVAGAGTVAAVLGNPYNGLNNVAAVVSALPGSGGTETVFVPAGTYQGIIEAGAGLSSVRTQTQPGSGSGSVTFTRGGSRLTGPSGTAKNFVVLGSSRTYPSGALTSRIGGAKYASQIQSVTVVVNGKVVKRVTRPRAGSALTASAAATKNATVKVNVVLRNGKKLSETATYLRCS